MSEAVTQSYARERVWDIIDHLSLFIADGKSIKIEVGDATEVADGAFNRLRKNPG